MRRALRCSIEGGSGAAPAVTLEDIYARHAWSWWWDASHGVDTGADTWTDRVAGYVASPDPDVTIATGTLAGVPSLDVIGPGFSGLRTASVAGLSNHLMRIFCIYALPSFAADELYSLKIGVKALAAYVSGETGVLAYGGAAISGRTGPDTGDGLAHVSYQAWGGTHAGHVTRVDGVALPTDAFTDDPDVSGASGLMVMGATADPGTVTIVAVCGIPVATINDTQAAQVETDLLTIMGL